MNSRISSVGSLICDSVRQFCREYALRVLNLIWNFNSPLSPLSHSGHQTYYHCHRFVTTTTTVPLPSLSLCTVTITVTISNHCHDCHHVTITTCTVMSLSHYHHYHTVTTVTVKSQQQDSPPKGLLNGDGLIKEFLIFFPI